MASSSNNNYSLHKFIIPSSLQITIALLLLMIPTTTTTGLMSEDAAAASSGPTLVQSSCELIQVSSLLPCTTFVQGTTAEPTDSCCDNLGDIYRQQPQCLCTTFLKQLNTSLFFNSFPINTTLLLNLPAVCDLQPDASTCKKMVTPAVKNNATVAASPMIQVAPKPTNVGAASLHSDSPKFMVVGANFFLGLVGVATITLLASPFN